ncbi:hypothetical protein [Rheinheimera sp.]|uniref:hypothetical protein n=1 Tax=Rheinheimera sp. TaxID=1869214 RepID=UPI0027B9C449|nr:hypothetical protein [Rheinheimera sp.]
MKQSWQSGSQPVFINIGKTRSGGLFSVIFMVLAALAFLVFGVGLLMIIATVAVLLFPWLWWKKKQLLKKMQQMQEMHRAQSGYQSEYSAAPDDNLNNKGVVIEGEVIVKNEQSNKNLS